MGVEGVDVPDILLQDTERLESPLLSAEPVTEGMKHEDGSKW